MHQSIFQLYVLFACFFLLLTGLRQSTQLAYHCFLNLGSRIKLLNQCIDHLHIKIYFDN
jgi:hypothetical protein